MHTFNQIIRAVLFALLTIIGMIMAVIFMASTALAIAILYVVARLSGRPFGIKSYWNGRRRPNPAQAFQQRTHANRPQGAAKRQNVSDIEMREIN
ncbi:hypothetical protein L1889_11710 [Paenalcaligenes niemegkensis]|uniref:hypothetical protein n=1 Tax=Paenalcaligenes niemegkensis TaxID=2895469 RepID=UPI001EE973DB|nr:hypothetical protein [Paenalcaligenes niemegkensis]MCQ9617273.1 hypothetical protein [Paenalcaligenes niemegkensis]